MNRGTDFETFTLTVLSIDDKPFVENEIEEIHLVEDFEYTWDLNLDNIFTDYDHDLSYRAVLNDPSVVGLSINENMMYLNAIPDGRGETDMIVTATSPLPSDENYALEFAATSDFLVSDNYSNEIFEGTSSFTVEVWYKHPGVEAGGNADIETFTSIVTNYRQLNGGDIYNNFNLTIDTYQNTGIVDFLGAQSNERLDDNYWHHIAAMYDSETQQISLYVDGILNDEVDAPSDDFTSSSNRIYVNNYGPIEGEVLGEASIAGLKLSSGAIYQANFVPLFPLESDENSLVTLDFTTESDQMMDLSGNNRMFFVGGSPTWNQGQGAFVTDVSDTVRVIVLPGNDDPVMVQLSDQSMDEDTVLKLALSGSDTDGDAIYFTASPAENVQSSINAAGDSLILIPDLNWNGTTEVMVSLFDTPGGSDNSTFTLTVNPVDDAPTQDGTIADVSFNEDFTTPWSVDLSTIFSDVDNELSYDAYLLDPSVADVQVAGSMVDLYAIPDGNGETEMVVMATGENSDQDNDG